MRCSNCNFELLPDDRFCPECGTKVNSFNEDISSHSDGYREEETNQLADNGNFFSDYPEQEDTSYPYSDAQGYEDTQSFEDNQYYNDQGYADNQGYGNSQYGAQNYGNGQGYGNPREYPNNQGYANNYYPPVQQTPAKKQKKKSGGKAVIIVVVILLVLGILAGIGVGGFFLVSYVMKADADILSQQIVSTTPDSYVHEHEDTTASGDAQVYLDGVKSNYITIELPETVLEPFTAYIFDLRGVNFRTGPSESYSTLTLLSKNTELVIFGADKYNWYLAYCESADEYGWVEMSKVSQSVSNEPDNYDGVNYYGTPVDMAVYSEHNLYLRKTPNQDYEEITLMDKNSPVKVLGESAEDSLWYYVEYEKNGVTYRGFCHSDYLVYVN